MDGSILTQTKKALGIEADYTAFDVDIIMHINTVLGTLSQLGIGPPNGFMIEDSETLWSDFLGADYNLNPVKTYMYLRVRILFDPPTTSFHIAAIKEEIKELEWRLSTHRESTAWVDPTRSTDSDLIEYENLVVDGGSA